MRSQPVANVKWPGTGRGRGPALVSAVAFPGDAEEGHSWSGPFLSFGFTSAQLDPPASAEQAVAPVPVRLTRPRGLPGLPTCPGAADELPWALSRSSPAGPLPTPPTRGVGDAPAGLKAPLPCASGRQQEGTAPVTSAGSPPVTSLWLYGAFRRVSRAPVIPQCESKERIKCFFQGRAREPTRPATGSGTSPGGREKAVTSPSRAALLKFSNKSARPK